MPHTNTKSTTCLYHLTAGKTCNWIHNLSHLFKLSQGIHTSFTYLHIILSCRCNLFPLAYLTYCRHLQLLENDKILLIVDDHNDGILVYLDSQQGISVAVSRPPRKTLHRSKIGKACIFSFDEGRRALAICETTKVKPSS